MEKNRNMGKVWERKSSNETETKGTKKLNNNSKGNK